MTTKTPGERVQSRREATPEPPEVEEAYEEMRRFRQPKGGKNIRKKTPETLILTPEMILLHQKTKTFFPPKTFFCNKHYFRPETRVHQKPKSLYSRHISHQAAQTFHNTRSP